MCSGGGYRGKENKCRDQCIAVEDGTVCAAPQSQAENWVCDNDRATVGGQGQVRTNALTRARQDEVAFASRPGLANVGASRDLHFPLTGPDELNSWVCG